MFRHSRNYGLSVRIRCEVGKQRLVSQFMATPYPLRGRNDCWSDRGGPEARQWAFPAAAETGCGKAPAKRPETGHDDAGKRAANARPTGRKPARGETANRPGECAGNGSRPSAGSEGQVMAVEGAKPARPDAGSAARGLALGDAATSGAPRSTGFLQSGFKHGGDHFLLGAWEL
jgi:hypothetical protein